MSVNAHGNNQPSITIEDLGGIMASEPPASASAAANAPITITRRINIKIQGSMSDFAQVYSVLFQPFTKPMRILLV